MLDIQTYQALPMEEIACYPLDSSETVMRQVPTGLNAKYTWDMERLHAQLPEGSIQLEAATHADRFQGGVLVFALHADGTLEWLATLGGHSNLYIHISHQAPRPPRATEAQQVTLARLAFQQKQAYVLYPGTTSGLGGSVQVWAELGMEQALRLAEARGHGPVYRNK